MLALTGDANARSCQTSRQCTVAPEAKTCSINQHLTTNLPCTKVIGSRGIHQLIDPLRNQDAKSVDPWSPDAWQPHVRTVEKPLETSRGDSPQDTVVSTRDPRARGPCRRGAPVGSRCLFSIPYTTCLGLPGRTAEKRPGVVRGFGGLAGAAVRPASPIYAVVSPVLRSLLGVTGPSHPSVAPSRPGRVSSAPSGKAEGTRPSTRPPVQSIRMPIETKGP